MLIVKQNRGAQPGYTSLLRRKIGVQPGETNQVLRGTEDPEEVIQRAPDCPVLFNGVDKRVKITDRYTSCKKYT